MPRKTNTKRKDGRYSVQIFIGRMDGKRKYKTVYGRTQKEADEKAMAVKLAMRKGLDVTSENDSFGAWKDRLLDLKEHQVSNGHYVSCEAAGKNLDRYIKDIPISKIKAADIQYIINDLALENPHTGNPSSRKTLQGVLSLASQVFQLAIDNRVLDYNPCSAVKAPKDAPKSKRRALTAEEQQWIIDTPHGAQKAAMIMMYAGLRRGELIPLTWNDIDLKEKTISINKAVEMIKGQPKLKDTAKSKAGLRVIDIPTVLVEFLKKQKKNANSVLVCPATSGRMMTSTAWKRMWESYLCTLNVKYGEFTEKQLKAMGINSGEKPKKTNPHGVPMKIPRFTAHWLRHTYATLLYMAGVDILTAKEQLGHADIKTTLEIYTHLDSIYKRKSMDKMDEYLNHTSHVQVK